MAILVLYHNFVIAQIPVPKILQEIPDPPKKLYIICNDRDILCTSKIIAIVGTRQMSDFGYQVTAKITKKLVEDGFIIISGLALGIDGVAHKTAIANGGKTIAVLGCGVDIVYPPAHKALYNSILEHGGAIISEIEPGKLVPREKFAARNRIIPATPN